MSAVISPTTETRVTIVMVPRERFSVQRRCLEQLYAVTPPIFQLTVVDGGGPPKIRKQLQALERRHPARRILYNGRFIHHHEARNQALPYCVTPWTVFLDNDVLVEPGWLDALLRCAEEERVKVVHPLYFISSGRTKKIHMAEGTFEVHRHDGIETLSEPPEQWNLPMAQIESLTRKPSDSVEFHGFMIETELLKRIAPFPPSTIYDAMDLTLRLKTLGERIVFEPAARITYYIGGPLWSSDLDYFRFRWSPEAVAESLRTFRSTWRWLPDTVDEKLIWLMGHRDRVAREFSWRMRLHRLKQQGLGWLKSGLAQITRSMEVAASEPP